MANVPSHLLAGVFRHTTNSYKHLFLNSIVSLLEKHNFQQLTLQLIDIYVEMAALAWYPHTYFRLSFGKLDRMGAVLDGFHFQPKSKWPGTATNQKALRQQLCEQSERIGIEQALGRYVPFLLLTPFFEQELKGINSDHAKARRILTLSQKKYRTTLPIYKLNGSSVARISSLTVHPDWCTYFGQNCGIVKGWMEHSWAEYLQERNPSVPAVLSKISIPARRNTLQKERKVWRAFIRAFKPVCIYSGSKLDADSFALDHFLPWSFVNHDQNWNLVPVTQAANSKKSNTVPDPKEYLEPMSLIHSEFLSFVDSSKISERAKSNIVAEYEAGLNITASDIADRNQFRNNYETAVAPLVSLAEKMGFGAGWRF
jgi:hypothetical protein